jgi:4-amino-4-deoxy-L-arabinose transferase-like glycosyltransferase
MYAARPQLTFRTHLIAIIAAGIAFLLSAQEWRPRGYGNLSAELTTDWYLGLAANLLAGRGYQDCEPAAEPPFCDEEQLRGPTAYRLPGYPIFLAGNLALFGQHDNAAVSVRLFQLVLTMLLVYLTAIYAARFAGDIAGASAGLLMATNPFLHIFSGHILTELFFTLLLLIFVIWLSRARRATHYLAAGVILAAVLLTRGNIVAAVPLLIFVIPRRYYAVFGLGAALLLIPWAARNYAVFQAFVPFSTGSGAVLLGASNPVTFGLEDAPDDLFYPFEGAMSWWLPPHRIPSHAHIYASITDPGDEVEVDRAEQRAALSFLGSVPRDLLLRMVSLRVATLFWDYGLSGAALVVAIPMYAWGLILVAGMWLSNALRLTIFSLLRERGVRVMLILILATILNAVLFYGTGRFRFPVDPLFAVLGGIGIASIVRATLRGRLRSRESAAHRLLTPSA